MNSQLFFTLFLSLMLLAGNGSLRAAEQPTVPAPPAAGGEHSGHQADPAPPAGHGGHDMAKPGEAGGMMACPSMDQMHKQQQEATVLVTQLRTEMEVIKNTLVPEARKKLIQTHLASMSKGLQMLKDSGCNRMMQEGKCPMMGSMQQEPSKTEPKMEPGKTEPGAMGHGAMMGHHGMMGKGHGEMMSMCHQMMQNKAELTNALIEQLIEMQGLQWAESK